MTASQQSPPDTAPAAPPGGSPPHGARAAAALAAATSRVARIAHRFGAGARRCRWLALPGELALVGFAALAVAHLLPSGEPLPGKAVAAASLALPAPPPATPQPPVMPPPPVMPQPPDMLQPSGALPAVQADPLPAPPASTAPATVRQAQRRTVKARASHKLRHTAKKARAGYARRWAWEACRGDQCGWGQPMTWHGGGY